MSSRRNFLTQTTLAAAACTVFRPLLSMAGPPPAPFFSETLYFLHTADLNGQASAIGAGLGGATTLQSTLQNFKRKHPQALLVHVGNVANPLKQSADDCLQLYRSFSAVGYDAVIPGESDVAKGQAYFAALAAEARLPLLNQASGGLLPNGLVKKGQFAVGLINASSVYDRSLQVQTKAINTTAAALKTRGCTVVICLAHKMSLQNKRNLAKALNNVDLMMGCAEKISLHNAEILCNQQGGEVVLSRAAANGATVSCVELTVGAHGERTGFAARNLFVGADNETPLALMHKYHVAYS